MQAIRDRLLRPDQVSQRLNVSTRSVYRIIEEGHVRALRVRGSLRVLESSVDEYLARQLAEFELEIGFPANYAND